MPYPTVPALKLGRLAVDERFQAQGIGRNLITTVIGLAETLASQVGCRYVTLDALPERVTYYEGIGFIRNRAVNEDRKQRFGQEPEQISMRFDVLAQVSDS